MLYFLKKVVYCALFFEKCALFLHFCALFCWVFFCKIGVRPLFVSFYSVKLFATHMSYFSTGGNSKLETGHFLWPVALSFYYKFIDSSTCGG